MATSGGGLGGGAANKLNLNFSAPGLPAGNAAKQKDEQRQVARDRQAVRQIGGKTFFLKGDRYVDSQASDEQIAKAQKVEQFGDSYFELIEKLGNRSKAFLAESTELLVVIDLSLIHI